MSAADALGTKLLRWCKEHGVDTVVAVLRDPDSSDVVCVKRGDRIWQMGAMLGLQEEAVHNWIVVEPKDDD